MDGMLPSAPGSDFGTLLRHYRRAAELTQEELAERAGISVRSISDLERGSAHRPRRDTVDMLIRALISTTEAVRCWRPRSTVAEVPHRSRRRPRMVSQRKRVRRGLRRYSTICRVS